MATLAPATEAGMASLAPATELSVLGLLFDSESDVGRGVGMVVLVQQGGG